MSDGRGFRLLRRTERERHHGGSYGRKCHGDAESPSCHQRRRLDVKDALRHERAGADAGFAHLRLFVQELYEDGTGGVEELAERQDVTSRRRRDDAGTGDRRVVVVGDVIKARHLPGEHAGGLGGVGICRAAADVQAFGRMLRPFLLDVDLLRLHFLLEIVFARLDALLSHVRGNVADVHLMLFGRRHVEHVEGSRF